MKSIHRHSPLMAARRSFMAPIAAQEKLFAIWAQIKARVKKKPTAPSPDIQRHIPT
jgi:hypothetical protein